MSKESSHGRAHRVAMIVDHGSNPFELGVATELFGLRRPELDRTWYDLILCTPESAVRLHGGFFTLTGVAGLDQVDLADTVIVPNRPDPEVPPSPAVLAAVRRAAARGARLVSFCTGAFPGRGRRARRAASHYALAVGRALHRHVPRGEAGAGRAVR